MCKRGHWATGHPQLILLRPLPTSPHSISLSQSVSQPACLSWLCASPRVSACVHSLLPPGSFVLIPQRRCFCATWIQMWRWTGGSLGSRVWHDDDSMVIQAVCYRCAASYEACTTTPPVVLLGWFLVSNPTPRPLKLLLGLLHCIGWKPAWLWTVISGLCFWVKWFMFKFLLQALQGIEADILQKLCGISNWSSVMFQDIHLINNNNNFKYMFSMLLLDWRNKANSGILPTYVSWHKVHRSSNITK